MEPDGPGDVAFGPEMSHFLSHLGVQKEMARQILERYGVFSKESLYQAIQSGDAGHLAWEDCIVWKNKEAHIARLRRMAGRE